MLDLRKFTCSQAFCFSLCGYAKLLSSPIMSAFTDQPLPETVSAAVLSC